MLHTAQLSLRMSLSAFFQTKFKESSLMKLKCLCSEIYDAVFIQLLKYSIITELNDTKLTRF